LPCAPGGLWPLDPVFAGAPAEFGAGASVARRACEPLVSDSVTGFGPTLLKRYNQTLWGLSYAAIANASLSLAFVGFERFYGSFRPGKNTVFQNTSILVRPHHIPWRGPEMLRT